MRTFKAKSVRLAACIQGDGARTYESGKLAALLVLPESKQALVATRDGRAFVAGYESAELAEGELERLTESHWCDKCGQTFDTGQALGSHRAFVHAGAEKINPLQAQAKPVKR
jgi:hypothetical protein